ncbi:MAG: site-2 protease family protein [Acidobacteria bacterium]|nr:site-2 protease family protein [Acidobacteriota bacterium]
MDIAKVAIQFIVLLFSLSIHEASHAWMADRKGDFTARYLGRVTLNPIPHIDPVGTIVFPLLMFFTSIPIIGWAKPVPVNPAHLRNPRKDNIYISLAGPGANLLAGFIAFITLIVLKIIHPEAGALILAFASGMPVSETVLAPIVGILFYAMVINIALAMFNCLPIPPLDGHWVLYGLLPDHAASALERMGRYGFLIIYALMFLGVLHYIFIPIYMVIGLLVSF